MSMPLTKAIVSPFEGRRRIRDGDRDTSDAPDPAVVPTDESEENGSVNAKLFRQSQ
jgi:hypothetical protein